MTSTILRINLEDGDIPDDSSDSDSDHHESHKKKHATHKKHEEKIKFHQINMMGAKIDIDTIKEGSKAIKNVDGKVTDTDHRFVYIIKGYQEPGSQNIAIDLIFNKIKELSQFNAWRECLELFTKSTAQTKMNRLAEVKRSIISSAGAQLDLQTRFSDKMLPEQFVPQSHKRSSSFGNRANLMRTGSVHTTIATPPTFRREKTKSDPPPIPGKMGAHKTYAPPPVPNRNVEKPKGMLL